MYYVFVSDIHSNDASLQQLLNYYDTSDSQLIFMGDYIDGFHQNGREGLEVIETISHLVGSGKAKAILGNHDRWLLDLFDPELSEGERYYAFIHWRQNGGRRSLYAWGYDHYLIKQRETHHLEMVQKFLSKPDIQPHIDFLETLPLYLNLGNILAVHAHFNFYCSLDEQDPMTLLWSRDYDLYNPDRIHPDFKGKTIVSGHTPVQTIHPDGSNTPITYKTGDLRRFLIDGGSGSTLDNRTINTLVLDGSGEIMELKQW